MVSGLAKNHVEGGVIRHLMQLSDLDNLLSVGTICYQFGESFLNVFLLHKLDNLLSVYIFYQYWITLLSVLGTISSGTDKVRNSGLGPDPDLSAKSGPE